MRTKGKDRNRLWHEEGTPDACGTSSSGNMAEWIVFRKTNSPEETIVNMLDEYFLKII